MSHDKRCYAWKFLQLRDGKIVSDYDGSPWTKGSWREAPAPTEECKGLNCSETIADAHEWVQGDVLARVEYKGAVIRGDRKLTCQYMRIVKAWHFPPTAWKAYEEAAATVWKAYEEATATAWRAYQEATATAWRAYQEATATAEKAYAEGVPGGQGYGGEENPANAGTDTMKTNLRQLIEMRVIAERTKE